MNYILQDYIQSPFDDEDLLLSHEEVAIFAEGQEAIQPPVPGVTSLISTDDDGSSDSSTRNDQPEVHEMNLRSGKKLPDLSGNKVKGKIPQHADGSKAL